MVILFIKVRGRLLTYGDKRSALILFIAASTGSARVQRGFAVNNKPVKMMSVAQFQALEPPAVEQSLHWERMPVVEVTDNFHPPSLRRCEIEVDRLK